MKTIPKICCLFLCLCVGDLLGQEIYNNNFNSVPYSGVLTKGQAKEVLRAPFVKGSEDDRVHIASAPGRGKVLKAIYPKGGVKTGNSGFLSKIPFDKPGDYEELYMSYWIYIPADFDFRAGAKIPGLGYQTPNRNMSLRLMWRYDGLLEYYVHYNSPSSENTIQINWTLEGNPYDQPAIPFPDQARLKKGAWNHIELYNKLNTPGVPNGIMRGWLNGKLAIDITNNRDYRTASEGDIKLNVIYMSTFFGGSTVAFQPQKDQYAYFDDIVVSTQRIGYPGGNTAPPTPQPTSNIPPTINFVEPAVGTRYLENDFFTLIAAASDRDGAIDKVEFFNNGRKIGEDDSAPYSVSISSAQVGIYSFTAKAIDNRGASTTSSILPISVSPRRTNPAPTPNPIPTPNPAPIPAPTPNPVPTTGCSFGTPGSAPLNSINRASYNTISVLGFGPDLSIVKRLRLYYNKSSNRLYQFAINTTNGVPSYYVDLRSKSVASFGAAQPAVDISRSGIAGLDGSYWVTMDRDNFVMVSKNGEFTIYFSNGTSPSCDGLKSVSNKAFEADQIVAFPNPTTDFINIQDASNTISSISIVDISGKVLFTRLNLNEGRLNLSSLQNGLYFINISQESGNIKTIQVIKN